MQLTHYTSTFNKRTFPITVLCENVSNAPNIGSLFRICDAFGVEKIVFSGEALPIPSRKMQKTSRATEKYVPFELINDINQYIENIKETHYLIAIEITEKSTPLHQQQFRTHKPIVLIIGDENFGVSETVLNQTDKIVHINMFGENSSMNVVQATNIALYEITKQLQEAV
ncbi:MAG: TrmH family RNA methyltransferase [Flavobacteriaceae bacterium]|nr:TrmH family RNA methyltransferase [Flavobacteriaceae bacterium]